MGCPVRLRLGGLQASVMLALEGTCALAEDDCTPHPFLCLKRALHMAGHCLQVRSQVQVKMCVTLFPGDTSAREDVLELSDTSRSTQCPLWLGHVQHILEYCTYAVEHLKHQEHVWPKFEFYRQAVQKVERSGACPAHTRILMMCSAGSETSVNTITCPAEIDLWHKAWAW